MKQRDYFLGGNTANGFFSYYDFLIRQEDAAKIYCIKGGPGTGKSSLMKSIAAAAQQKGLDIDRIHCSSDPDSLDGLVIPARRLAFVDGTSPHADVPVLFFWRSACTRRNNVGAIIASWVPATRTHSSCGTSFIFSDL